MVLHGVVTCFVHVGKDVSEDTRRSNVVEAWFALGTCAMWVHCGFFRMHSSRCVEGRGWTATSTSAPATCTDGPGTVVEGGSDSGSGQRPEGDGLVWVAE